LFIFSRQLYLVQILEDYGYSKNNCFRDASNVKIVTNLPVPFVVKQSNNLPNTYSASRSWIKKYVIQETLTNKQNT